MAITFDGPTKVITLSSGTVELDVADLYSRWKDWVGTGNAQYQPAFNTVGGETINASAGTKVPLYAFLINGWKIKPQEANHTLNVTNGILLVDGGGDPFNNTTGSFVVRINYQQPVQAITVATGGGGGGATAAQVWQYAIENGLSAEVLMRIMVAALSGKTTGVGTTNEIYKSIDGLTNRLNVDFDGSGNRTTVTLNGS
jgi:hypothetical protein